MKRYRELTIVTPNKPGKLAQVLGAIARERINVVALDSSSGFDLNTVRLITADPARAKRTLEKLHYHVGESTVLGVALPDRPGTLAKLTKLLAANKINNEYMYFTAVPPAGEALVIFEASDIDGAERVLESAGMN